MVILASMHIGVTGMDGLLYTGIIVLVMLMGVVPLVSGILHWGILVIRNMCEVLIHVMAQKLPILVLTGAGFRG